MKKILALATLLVLVACGGKKEEITKNEGTQKKEFSIFAVHLGKVFDSELPVYKKAEELTNVKLKGVASKNQTDQVQAYNLLLSSGNMPDIIAYELADGLEKLGSEGGLIPLEKLIDEHGPNIKAFWDKYPRYKKDAVAANGHIYMIPNYNDYYNIRASQGYFIRKDWLEKLGLEEPKTIEDFYNVLVAFKTKDPNGNGKADEVPFFSRANLPRKVLISLIDMFQVEPSWYEVNGKVVFGPSQEDYKKAIKEMAKWYKEGLIDQEIFTRGLGTRDFMLNNNIGGMTNDWFASTASYNEILNKSIEGFNFEAILPPEYNGKRITKNARATYMGGWGITFAAKDPIEIIKYFDFWYSEEGRRLWNFGIEGKEWELKDGKPKFTEYVLKNPDGKNPLTVIRESGAQYRLGMFQDGEYEKQWGGLASSKAIDLYTNNNAIAEPFPFLKYKETESREFIKIDSQLRNYIEEMAQKWLMGSSDIDKDWDSYLKRLNDIGLEKAEKIQQESYDRFMAN